MYIICDVVLWFCVIHLLAFLLRVVSFVFENIRHVGVGIVSLFLESLYAHLHMVFF